MKLPYPFIYDGETVTEFEPGVLTARDLADGRKANAPYAAMKALGAGAIRSLNGNEDRAYVSGAVPHMPFFSLYAALVCSGARTKGVDYVEGRYVCPKCGTVRAYGKDDDDDMSDRLEDLMSGCATDTELQFQFGHSVNLYNRANGEALQTVTEVVMRHPTIGDYVRGESRYPDDSLRAMYFAYGSALLSVEGKPVDANYRQKFGELIFQSLDVKTVNALSSKLSEYAVGMGMERQCLKCHHVWKADLDVSGFFDFGQ